MGSSSRSGRSRTTDLCVSSRRTRLPVCCAAPRPAAPQAPGRARAGRAARPPRSRRCGRADSQGPWHRAPLPQTAPATADWPRWPSWPAAVTGSWRDPLSSPGYELEQLPRGYLARYIGRAGRGRPSRRRPRRLREARRRGPAARGGARSDDCRERARPTASLRRVRASALRGGAGDGLRRRAVTSSSTLPRSPRTTGRFSACFDAVPLQRGLREAHGRGTARLRRRSAASVSTRRFASVLPPLGLELGRWAACKARDLADDARRARLEAAALTFVFRALFLLYAESAGTCRWRTTPTGAVA